MGDKKSSSGIFSSTHNVHLGAPLSSANFIIGHELGHWLKGERGGGRWIVYRQCVDWLSWGGGRILHGIGDVEMEQGIAIGATTSPRGKWEWHFKVESNWSKCQFGVESSWFVVGIVIFSVYMSV